MKTLSLLLLFSLSAHAADGDLVLTPMSDEDARAHLLELKDKQKQSRDEIQKARKAIQYLGGSWARLPVPQGVVK